MKIFLITSFMIIAGHFTSTAQNYNNNTNIVNNNGNSQSSAQSSSSYTDAYGRVHNRTTIVQNGITYVYEDGKLIQQYRGNGSYSNNTGNQNQNNVNTLQQVGQQPCPTCYRMVIPTDPPAANNNNSSTSNTNSTYTDANGRTHSRSVITQNGMTFIYIDGQLVQQYQSNGSNQNNTGNGNNNSNRNNQQQRRQQSNNGGYYR